MQEQYAICKVSIAPLRAEGRDQSEIVSQLLFGEAVEVLQKTAKWWHIHNAGDGYEGWVDFKQLKEVDSASFFSAKNQTYLAPAEVNNTLIAADDSKYYLAASSNLPHFQDGFCYLGEEKFKVNFKPLAVGVNHEDRVKELALFFLNSPYLWGGRTLFGIDCSGLVQAVFKMAGVQLKRDASQQAKEGILVDFLPAARTGDVAFFDNEEGRITHVGILLGNNEIIHASGKVRIDPIDDQGIFNKELHCYTHKLRIIKRFI